MVILDVTSPSFVVMVQDLGIEDAVTTENGSYRLTPIDGEVEVVLTTTDDGHRRPRWFWRRLERYLGRSASPISSARCATRRALR